MTSVTPCAADIIVDIIQKIVRIEVAQALRVATEEAAQENNRGHVEKAVKVGLSASGSTHTPRMAAALNYDDKGRPLFEVDGKGVGPADHVLLTLLEWKRHWGGKAAWAQIDAFKDAFVQP